VRTRADPSVYAAEKMLQDVGDKVGETEKAAVQSAIEALKGAIAANNVAGMTAALETLTQAQHKLSEVLYRQQAETGEGTPGSGGDAPGSSASSAPGESGGGGQGDVIDAEVVDEK
jgi:molecular chaperone DnaK